MLLKIPARVAVAIIGVAAGMSLALAACDDGEPERVALAEIVGNESRYDGRTLILQGHVRGFDDPDGGHYVIEDEHQNRVQLLPNEVAEDYEDQEVTVTGTFTFREDEGRRIEVEEIE